MNLDGRIRSSLSCEYRAKQDADSSRTFSSRHRIPIEYTLQKPLRKTGVGNLEGSTN